MTQFIWWEHQWVQTAKSTPRPRIAIISDTMDALVHPVTGKRCDSKSQFRRMTKDAGCVELGNDMPDAPVKAPVGDLKTDIAEAMQMLDQGYQPPPLETADSETKLY